jgi:hypothetical protein
MTRSPSGRSTDRQSTPASATSAERQAGASAPFGIKVLCGARAALVLVGLVLSIPLFQAGGPGTVAGLLVVGLLGLELSVTYGLWTLRYWGWVATLVLGGLSVCYSLTKGVPGLVGALVGGYVLYYVYSQRDRYRTRRASSIDAV